MLQRPSKFVTSPIRLVVEPPNALAALMAFYQIVAIEFSVTIVYATAFIAVLCIVSKSVNCAVRSMTGGRVSIVYLTISYLPSLIEVFMLSSVTSF